MEWMAAKGPPPFLHGLPQELATLFAWPPAGASRRGGRNEGDAYLACTPVVSARYQTHDQPTTRQSEAPNERL